MKISLLSYDCEDPLKTKTLGPRFSGSVEKKKSQLSSALHVQNIKQFKATTQEML